ncbi:coiled-coil-helix-coiled-coil-helix domain-containing protein 4 [Hordeum vulgare]|nr:coiled-coil-helix-coiled-coil-helix domain-containing protein 4 [Hordeum vulgare]
MTGSRNQLPNFDWTWVGSALTPIEAMSFSKDDEVQKALDCPCVADLKTGPCGSGFLDAFSCFLRSTEVEKLAQSCSDEKHFFNKTSSERRVHNGLDSQEYMESTDGSRIKHIGSQNAVVTLWKQFPNAFDGARVLQRSKHEPMVVVSITLFILKYISM